MEDFERKNISAGRYKLGPAKGSRVPPLSLSKSLHTNDLRRLDCIPDPVHMFTTPHLDAPPKPLRRMGLRRVEIPACKFLG